MTTKLSKLALVALAITVPIMVLGARSGGESQPGSPAVYAEISASSDCAWLQTSFDQASENNDRAPAGSSAFDWSLGYMRAADERMEAVGCYR